jgi:hypothetical protein
VTTYSFTPVRSLRRLFAEDMTPYRHIFILGPVGSTKTTTILHFIMMKAAQQEPSPDGIRRTRFGIIRTTLESLKRTVLKDVLSLFGEVIDWRPSSNTCFFKLGDIESEWYFLPVETPQDQKRLGSLQLTAIFVNEAREIPLALMLNAYSRTGRFPSLKHGGVICTHRFIIADSNMGVDGSDLHQYLEQPNPPEQLLYIHQPSAFSRYCDWRQFLPVDYYEDLMIGATKQWIDQHVRSKWGQDLSGEPVYGQSFDRDTHVSRKRIPVFPDRPLLCGMDPGLNPAMLVSQVAPNGQLMILAEAHAANQLFRSFLTDTCIPLLQSPRFVSHELLFTLDPSGQSRNAMTKDTPFGVMKEMQLETFLAVTNELGPRIRSVERWLLENRTGYSEKQAVVPAMWIDPSCTAFIQGFEGGYRYKRNNAGELNPIPEKKHPVSDIHDCGQYICLALSGRRVARRAQLGNNRAPLGAAQSMPREGWT